MGERFAYTDDCKMRKASIRQVPTGLCQRKFGASESLQPLKTVGGLGHCHSECKYAPFWICQKNPDSLVFWQLFASVSSNSKIINWGTVLSDPISENVKLGFRPPPATQKVRFSDPPPLGKIF